MFRTRQTDETVETQVEVDRREVDQELERQRKEEDECRMLTEMERALQEERREEKGR